MEAFTLATDRSPLPTVESATVVPEALVAVIAPVVDTSTPLPETAEVNSNGPVFDRARLPVVVDA